MNETYWVVVEPDGIVHFSGLRLSRLMAVNFYTAIWHHASGDDAQKREWRKQYRKGVRCIKVRLVPVEDE